MKIPNRMTLAMRRRAMRRQRIARGYSDIDAANGDQYLATVISAVLKWHVYNTDGVSAAYAVTEDDEDGEEPNIYAMIARRDADFLRVANIFDRYVKEGFAYDEEWQKGFGGVLESELQIALIWLSEHFTELWEN